MGNELGRGKYAKMADGVAEGEHSTTKAHNEKASSTNNIKQNKDQNDKQVTQNTDQVSHQTINKPDSEKEEDEKSLSKLKKDIYNKLHDNYQVIPTNEPDVIAVK